MLKLLAFFALVFAVRAEWFEENAAKFGVEVSPKNPFHGWSLKKVKTLMGARLDRKVGDVHPVMAYSGIDLATLPVNFTATDKWPKCASVLNYIKDQAACGSCWAVAASNVIAARTCIANYNNLPSWRDNGMVGLNEPAPQIDFSSEQVLSCCSYCGDGCQGGYPIDAMKYWEHTGVVTGGWYGSNCGCYPYGVPPCPKGCQEGPTPKCHTQCQKGYSKSFSQDKHYATRYYEISREVATIQNEIYTNGPIECAFTVYENFMHYPKGKGIKDNVYYKREGSELGGHAITVYGWGKTRSGIDYWIIHNSWNVTWGLNGAVLFRKGNDLCGIESQCVAGIAKPNDSNFQLKC